MSTVLRSEGSSAASPALPRQVSDALARGWTVVTANQRAARTLRRRYDLAQQAAESRGWELPQIFAWETWLGMLWRRLLVEGEDSRFLLSQVQEHALWADVIASDSSTNGAGFRPVAGLAELAAEAWRLVHGRGCRPALAGRADTADTRAFARWAAHFDRLCARGGYLSPAELPEVLRHAVAGGTLRLTGTGGSGVLLVGFDRRTPAEEALLAEFARAGVTIEEAATPRKPDGDVDPGVLLRARDADDERNTCAQWLREFVEANPAAHVAVIVPSAAAARTELERTLRHVLAPELEEMTADTRQAAPFEFSLGMPLAGTAMAAAALEILAWSVEPLPPGRVSSLLLSPYFARGSEHLARAEFDAFAVRQERLLDPTVSIHGVAALLARSRCVTQVPELLRHLRRLHAEAERVTRTALQTYAGWAESFARLLDAAGWADGLDSVEFQARRRWEAALDELASLDFAGDRVGFDAALAALRRVAGGMLFAPESEDAPVQVMGPLESAGSEFDAVWFLDAGDAAWPARTRPNPLVPWSLAREHAMPGVDPERDMQRARAITDRIRASAPVAVFSYAGEAANGHQRPSPVLAGLGFEPKTAEQMVRPELAAAPVLIERIADESVIAPPPKEGFRGGAEVLKAQAACGFRAFAERRLFSSALDAREPGLNAMERGSVIHRALEGFWRVVETQAGLKQLSAAERAGTLAAAVDEALEAYRRSAESAWARAYLATERARLMNLLGRWLDFEATRSPFVVQALEETLREVQIGPLRLTVRVDRVDLHLTEGQPAGEILLDYKTGVVKPADWLTERPDEPQLPLYAVVSGGERLAGIAFASLRAGDGMKMSGYEADKGVVPKASKLKTGSLDEQVAEWRAVLAELARQFHAGEARVAPKKYPATCRYCEQRLLCRLDPAKLEPEALEELEELGTDWEAQFA